MDITSLLGTSSMVTKEARTPDAVGTTKTSNVFDTILSSAIDNVETTNGYLSDAENEMVSFALGETESTHDLMIALQKASTALQYTVAVRDKFLEAYKEIMQMQI